VLDWEIKASRNELSSSLWETVSAFANTQGGWILLGIVQRGEDIVVEGISNAHKMMGNLHNLMRNRQKISYPVCDEKDASVLLVDDKEVIALRVPAAPRRVRPVYIGNNPYTGAYVRRHEGDYRCNKAEVDRMMRKASDVAADSTILNHYTMDDLDRDALASYRRRYQTLHSSSAWNSYDDDRFLKAIKAVRRDRDTDEEGITVAGLLLLGTSSGLRDWRTRHLIDYRLVDSDASSETRWSDRLAWEDNLLGAYDAIYPRLVDGLRLPFRLEGTTRVDETQMHVVLREALVNLLIHADYAETGASLISRSTQGGYLFRNPGSSRVSESDLLVGDRSDPRNPILVQMFRYIGLAEEAGTGIPNIVRAWRDFGFRMPRIDVGTERYEFTLELRPVHFIEDEDRAWLQRIGNVWTEQEQLALVIARHSNGVDNLTLRRVTGQHPVDVTKVLSNLRARGFLVMNRGGRQTRYQLGPKAETNVVVQKLTNTLPETTTSVVRGQAPDVSQSPNEGKSRSEGTASNSEDSGVRSEGTASNSEDSGVRSEGTGGDMWTELMAISRSAREKSRITPGLRDDIIVRLCTRTELSLPALSQLMNRSEAYMREALRSLIAAGRLAFLYPNQPNHPQQKYVARSIDTGV